MANVKTFSHDQKIYLTGGGTVQSYEQDIRCHGGGEVLVVRKFYFVLSHRSAFGARVDLNIGPNRYSTTFRMLQATKTWALGNSVWIDTPYIRFDWSQGYTPPRDFYIAIQIQGFLLSRSDSRVQQIDAELVEADVLFEDEPLNTIDKATTMIVDTPVAGTNPTMSAKTASQTKGRRLMFKDNE